MLPPRSILVPVDFSEPSRVALMCGARLARHCGAELHTLHAQAPLLDAAAAMQDIDLLGGTRRELASFMQSAPPAGDWLPIQHVETGEAPDVIAHAIARHHVDLVVMGPRGLSPAVRLLLGSVTRAVLQSSPAHVLVVPSSWQAPGPGRDDLAGMGPVVAAVETCDAPGPALAAGAAMALTLQTSLEVVHVARRGEHARARRALAASLQALGEGPPATVHVIEDASAAEGLAAFAASGSRPHALLCIGAHDAARAHNVERALLALLTHWSVPVLVAKPSS
jgi:nucleotide-binding universal stress UspA family protein